MAMNIKFGADTSQISTDLKKFASTQTYKIKIDADGKGASSLNTEVNKYKDTLGKTVTETKTFNTATNQMTTTLKASETAVKGLGADFVDTLGKVAKFGAVTAIIGAFTAAVSGAISITKDFDDAQTELKKVSNLSGDSLDTYTQKLSELGETVARTSTEMTESAVSFKRSGYSDEESAKLAQISELYKNVADSEIDSATSSNFLISQMKAFNITANDSIKIINSVNEVANQFAVDTDDLQTALEKTGSALGTLGNSFEQTIGLVEAGTSVMQGQAGKVGRGLRTIGINLNTMAQTSEKLVSANGKVNVSFRDESGQLKSTYEIMSDLSPQWETLTNEQKSNLATTIAG